MEARQNWSKKLEFLLAIIGYAVGLGNVWRFPYLCFRSGGGAFLIPFFIMLVVCGVPLAYMEMAIGQYTRQGPIGAIGKMCPFFKGAGVATVVISFLFTTYYIIIITWSFYYMFSCFTDELPWTHCNHTWNSPLCWLNTSTENFTAVQPNGSRSPTEDFFIENVLERSSGIDEQGTFR
ncbi:sodium- and chloride-dependent GABA transporter ine, partial [Aplysia californica]|uniref:Transporter n=1 Tax=Aplysia californica TaxID=6500 RepID=A0ABM1A3Y1_APLCA